MQKFNLSIEKKKAEWTKLAAKLFILLLTDPLDKDRLQQEHKMMYYHIP